jgi:hypothetical protein
MTRDQLLAPTKGELFRPFEIRTTSGETYRVTNREQYWVSPKGETVLVYLGTTIAFIDGDHIAEFVRLVRPPRRKKEA